MNYTWTLCMMPIFLSCHQKMMGSLKISSFKYAINHSSSPALSSGTLPDYISPKARENTWRDTGKQKYVYNFHNLLKHVFTRPSWNWCQTVSKRNTANDAFLWVNNNNFFYPPDLRKNFCFYNPDFRKRWSYTSVYVYGKYFVTAACTLFCTF